MRDLDTGRLRLPIQDMFTLLLVISVMELIGVIGAIFTVQSIPRWYDTLIQPAFNPPSWVFSPVWTFLYALMGGAAWLVWRTVPRQRNAVVALGIFTVQLILNVLWSLMFFGLRNPGAALIEIGFLWLAILATIIAFARISKPAAWLLAPYMLWVTFAVYLNYAFWVLN